MHSPEPWVYSRIEAQSAANYHEPCSPFVIGAGPRLVRVDRTTMIHADDYQRIVACVNACAGIPTKELQQLVADNKRLSLSHNEDIV